MLHASALVFALSTLFYAEPVAKFRVDSPIHVAFSSDAKSLIVGSLLGEIVTCHLPTKTIKRRVFLGREIRDYEPGPPGQIYTLHADGTVALRNLETGGVIRTAQFGRTGINEMKYGKDSISDIQSLPGGRVLALVFPERQEVRFVQFPDKHLFSLPYHRAFADAQAWGAFYVPYRAFAVAQARGAIAMFLEPGKIGFYNPWNGKLQRTLNFSKSGSLLALSPDSRTIAIASPAGSPPVLLPVLLVDAATGKTRQRVGGSWEGGLEGGLFSPDGKSLLLSETRRNVWLYSARTGRCLANYSGDYPGPVAFAPNGRLVAVGFDRVGGEVRVYKVP